MSKFKAFLATHRVPEVVQQFMLKTEAEGGLEMACISDFASAFTDKTYQEDIKTMIVDKTDAKDSLTGLGRVRTAWTFAMAELTKATKAVGAGSSPMDYDTPLGETEETTRKDQFDGAYSGLAFEPETTPMATIVARFFREFRSRPRQMTMALLKRMRSDAECKNTPPSKRERLAERVEITYDSERMPDRKFGTVLDVLHAVKICTNAMALAGANEIESKTEYDDATKAYKMVKEVHLSQAIAYADFVFQKAREHPGPEHITINWLIDRDIKTRSQARKLFVKGWPYGEALTQATQMQCAVLWNLGAVGVAKRQPAIMGPNDLDMDVDADNDVDHSWGRSSWSGGGKGGKDSGKTKWRIAFGKGGSAGYKGKGSKKKRGNRAGAGKQSSKGGKQQDAVR